jgi:membrane protein implicated in regulation of membrane protease activity
MTSQFAWWRSPVVFLVCIILAGIIVNALIPEPYSTASGAMMMCLVIVLAVILKATFQFFMSRRQRQKGININQDNQPGA